MKSNLGWTLAALCTVLAILVTVANTLALGSNSPSIVSTLDARPWKRQSTIPTNEADTVWRFQVDDVREVQDLLDVSHAQDLDVWSITDDWVDIRLSSNLGVVLQSRISKALMNRSHILLSGPELHEATINTYPSNRADSSLASLSDGFTAQDKEAFFNEYQPLPVIEPWMRLLSSMFQQHVRKITIGTTWEGRDIYALRVGVHPTDKKHKQKPRKTVLITGGSHAREWISTSSVAYIANYLTTNYGRLKLVTQLLENFDWVLVPTLNPDGYAYTWDHDRLWRKNTQQTNELRCPGLDLDRSFSFQWSGAASSGPCSESYAGNEPFEAVEAKAFADWARNETENNNVQFVALLDLHAYSQQVLYPYSYSCYDLPPSLENLEELALGLAKGMRSSDGLRYTAVSACEPDRFAYGLHDDDRVFSKLMAGRNGGSALDWFYHELRVPYTYQIKLRDTGSYGFLLPKENIVPTGKEALAAVIYLGRFLHGTVGLQAHSVPYDIDLELEDFAEGSAANDAHVDLR